VDKAIVEERTRSAAVSGIAGFIVGVNY